MRPVLHGDVSNAARALLGVPKTMRSGLLDRLIREAEAADRHVRRTGRLHPLWGNGSLMSAARKRVLVTEPGFDDSEYCQCFGEVLEQLVAHRINQKRS